ncbi:MAG: methionine adenosyltransferase [Desulfobacteraceae bacterium]|jgi:S-adenosylmethionine synthetase|nr:methionine adenosyltransferase [Desulfobacteraceae bacterium]
MSKIFQDHVFTSESVSEGHPDKICDQLSDAMLDACLKADPESRVACETTTTTNHVMEMGEITCKGFKDIDSEKLARDVIKNIGYDQREYQFCYDTFDFDCRLHEQSPDISQGVSKGEGLFEEQGAGDQGMMFGYASNATPDLMPAPIYYSHKLMKTFSDLRKSGEIDYLRPDSKAQVSVRYEDGDPQEVTSVVISHQTDEVSYKRIKDDFIEVINNELNGTGLISSNTEYLINPTGRFVIGGPHGDAGLTGRKIIVDTYGGVASHGGGAFSGKDPSKVDRSAAYYSRYAAKNIVAAGLAKRCEIQVAYAIGISKPVSINVNTYNTGIIDDSELQKILETDEIFDFRPAALIEALSLKYPVNGWSYQDTAAYGHFGRDIFPWEKTDKAEVLKNIASAYIKKR